VGRADPSQSDQPRERRIFPVSALLGGLSRLLEDEVGRLWVVGQVRDLRRAGSGHVYFTLADEGGQIRAALFRSAARRIPFELEEGAEVVVHADVTLYAARGDLQLVVRSVEPRGMGALQLAFEQLRRRLEVEGLFDAARKRPLPAFPRRLGIVTSASGAAIRDVIHVAARRFPSIPILLSPTRVQGDGSPAEIARALERLTATPGRDDVDVVLLVRGGGSLEDLVSFNSEVVARAIARCPVPVVCGVGHEVDVTIADLVADARAATPSAAAALALPDCTAVGAALARNVERLTGAARALLREGRRRLVRERDALRVLAPSARLASQRARLQTAVRALVREGAGVVARRRTRLASALGRLDSLSPLAVLSRGYAMVRRARDGQIVRSPAEAPRGERLRIRVATGELAAVSDPAPGAATEVADEPGSRPKTP
jgi:exodeoxyribonuclease VII large subunit